jgi:DNA-binding MarR family transcriptional regulator
VTPPERSLPPTEQLRLVQEASYLALGLAQRLQDNFAAHAAGLGLTAAQAKVLVALHPDQPVPQRALAEQLGYDPSNLSGLVDKLEELGAVQRRPGEVDRRIKMVVLTKVGQQTRDAFWGRLTNDAGPLAHLTTAQVRELRDRLADALGDGAPDVR